MEITLERGDLLQLDPITYRHTMRLLPVGKKGRQKLLIGDDSGSLCCYEFKKGEPLQVFNCRLFEEPITCVTVGGVVVKQDKIFVSSAQKILGITKKGKEFFKLTSSLTETFHNIIIDDNKLYSSCEFIYNMYDNGIDKEFYMNKDIINSLTIDHLTKEQDYDVIFGCQDNCIRIINNSQLLLEFNTISPVTEIAINIGFANTLIMLQQQQSIINLNNNFNNNNNNNNKSDPFGSLYLIYGMENGSLGMINLQYNNPKSQSTITPIITYTECWLLEDYFKKRVSAITAIQIFDLNKTGVCNIIIGRDDGRIEVYSQSNAYNNIINNNNNNNNMKNINPPQLICSKDINESVRSIDCGLVNSTDFNEIIVAGYSGKIISFTTEPIQERAQDDKHGRSLQTVNDENRIKHIKTEIEQLKLKIDKEKEKMKKLSTIATDIVASTVLDFPINSKFILDNEKGMYLLTIELQTPIDLILIRSSVLLDLVEAEIGNSMISITNQSDLEIFDNNLNNNKKNDNNNNNNNNTATINNTPAKFCASFRCQNNEKRLRLNLRSMEGDYGDLDITVVTAGNSGTLNASLQQKTAKILKFPLKPLSLHSRINLNNLSDIELNRSRIKLKFVGNSLQMQMIVTWIQSIFIDVPQKLLGDDSDNINKINECKLYYKNVYTEAIVVIEFRSKELRFECESISTIAIIKENITRLATYNRVNIEESLDINDTVIISYLNLIYPKLFHQVSLSKNMEIMDAIQEIVMQDSNPDGNNNSNNKINTNITIENYPWLSTEYINIAKNQEQIRYDFKLREKSLAYLSGIITDLYVDYNKLKYGGMDSRSKLPELHKLIYIGDLKLITNYFLNRK